MKTDELDFDLPRELIAQTPAVDRPASRLLHYRRTDGVISHRTFADLPSLLRPGDLLVFNNARVVPARFTLIKPTGGRVEALFVAELTSGRWRGLLKNVGPWTPKTTYAMEDPSGFLPPRGRIKEGADGARLDEGRSSDEAPTLAPSLPSPGGGGVASGNVGSDSASSSGLLPPPGRIKEGAASAPSADDARSSNEAPALAPSLPSPGGGEERSALDAPSVGGISARILEHLGEGEFLIGVDSNESAFAILDRVGRMPLPPYIRREKGHDARDELDRDRYQTVYAAAPGSVAAPTAGLHFDETILAQLHEKGIEQTHVTLNVGLGTFKPVTADALEGHTMHVESYSLDDIAAEQINRARREGRRVIAVGTTAARVLESQPPGELQACTGETGIFIYPPYTWKHVDALVTNFHLPRSTLIALVAAFVGLEPQRRIYAEAIAQRYRFFSYGDSSFLE